MTSSQLTGVYIVQNVTVNCKEMYIACCVVKVVFIKQRRYIDIKCTANSDTCNLSLCDVIAFHGF